MSPVPPKPMNRHHVPPIPDDGAFGLVLPKLERTSSPSDSLTNRASSGVS